MKDIRTYIIIIISYLPLISAGQSNNTFIDSTRSVLKVIPKDSISTEKRNRSDQFYDTLKLKASKNRITKTALELILKEEPDKGIYIGEENIRKEKYFKIYEGKKIRKIEIVKLDVFGPALNDSGSTTLNWIQKAGNNTHIKTRDFIIENNLLFSEGDSIDPTLLIDNERIFRELDYIKDANIQIIQVPGDNKWVDILVITKDVYSTGFNVDLWNLSSGSIDLYENNLAGIGHKVQARWLIDVDENPSTGYSFKYNINNIGNTFIKSSLQYYKAFHTERLEIKANRPFFSYNTKWAGHISFSQTSTLKDIKKTNTILTDTRLNYATGDYWLSRSFMLKTDNIKYTNRTRLVLGARFIKNKFYKGPEVSERYNFDYHDNQILLGSLSFSRQKFYTSNLIYAFGKTEDIPVGLLAQVNAGFEKDEFFNRPYAGLILANGLYYNKIGYLNFRAELGGLYYDDRIEQGGLNFNAKAISNLHYIKHIKFRNFLSLNYTRGVNRFPDEKIYFNSVNDIWGFSSDNLYGLKKLSFNYELVAFTNLYLYNFRFVFFGFGDFGWIGPENKSIFRNKLYSGIGLGVRVRNENLVFKTFQIRFAFYPSVPTDVDPFYLMVSGESYLKHTYFEPEAPSTIDFQ
ncbi:MAG TPA: hypothetical protein VJ896_09835 [Bacteroidales bacterium]|nr:hypothetical protein [Bacteroidales bacterium]